MAVPRLTRRRFLAGSAGGLAGVCILFSPRAAFGAEANERLHLAVVGVGGYGAAVGFIPAIHLYSNTSIVALCDVDQRKVPPALKLWEERAATWPTSSRDEQRRAAEQYQRLVKHSPPLFEDFRQMLDRMGRQIDAVVVATPDHTHAVASAAALRAGKHAFCEKPLTITVHESRTLRRLAFEAKWPPRWAIRVPKARSSAGAWN